jgi:peroxiredoxin
VRPGGLGLALALVVGLASCAKASNDQATGSLSSPASSATPTSVVAQAPMPPNPPMKAYSAPPAERLGVLAPNTGMPVGSKAPDGHARDLDGKDVALSSLYARGPILLIFYRGGWCPYCNFEIHAFTTGYPEYRKRGVTPVAVSVDKPEAEARMQATYSIPFPVLSDSDVTIISSFHVARIVGTDESTKMKGFGVDLESYSGRTHHEIAIPALFLIDRAGTVRWAHSDPDIRVRPSTEQILAVIDAIGPT